MRDHTHDDWVRWPVWWRSGELSHLEAILVGVYYRELSDFGRPCEVLQAHPKYL